MSSRSAWSGLKKGRPNPVVCGRKFCAHCGRWRLVAIDFDKNERTGRFRSWCRTCQRESNRKSVARRTPEQKDIIREYHRFWHEAKRRAAGIPERDFNYARENRRRRVTPIDRVERVFLDPAPLVGEIRRWCQWHLPEWCRDPARNIERLGEWAMLEPRTIGRLLTGESQHVQLDVADKLAVALDIPLACLYPDGEELAA